MSTAGGVNSVGEGSHQVFLCTSPSSMPVSVSMVPHTWFVVNQRGSLSRWEVLFRRHQDIQRWGHLHLNEREPFEGLDMFAYVGGPRWQGSVLSVIEGDDHSLAATMGTFILNSPHTYPHRDIYSMFGPNCNTYTQWIINHFPDSGFALPFRALGRGH